MRSGKYVAVPLKGCVPRPPWHLRKAITFPSRHRLHASDTEKELQYYPSNALFARLLPSSLTGYFHSHNFPIFRFLPPVLIASPSVSPGPALSRRESFISRMKVLLLFDCARKVMTAAHHPPSYAARLFMLGSLITVPLSPSVSLCPPTTPPLPDPHPPLKQNGSQSFILGLKKKYRANRSGIEKPLRTTHQRSPGNLNILLNFTTQRRALFNVTCSPSGGGKCHGRLGKLPTTQIF